MRRVKASKHYAKCVRVYMLYEHMNFWKLLVNERKPYTFWLHVKNDNQYMNA